MPPLFVSGGILWPKVMPPSEDDGDFPTFSTEGLSEPVAVLVPVEIAGKSMRVNISVEEGLLSRIDMASHKMGLSRSGFLALGAQMVIATQQP